MTEKKTLVPGRRHFIKGFSLVLLSGHLVKASQERPKDNKQPLKLSDEFSPKERKTIEDSVMAQEIIKYRARGYNCAETILLTSLKFLGKPNEWVSAASGFGGGMGHRDVCGLLTGSIMAIGISAGKLHPDRKLRRAYIKQKRNEFWKWWISLSPIKCQDMKGRYNRDDYLRMIQRVASKIEELIKSAKA